MTDNADLNLIDLVARRLQHEFILWNRVLNIPNFTGKRYPSVKIRVCMRYNRSFSTRRPWARTTPKRAPLPRLR
jgi:hypothetical protein